MRTLCASALCGIGTALGLLGPVATAQSYTASANGSDPAYTLVTNDYTANGLITSDSDFAQKEASTAAGAYAAADSEPFARIPLTTVSETGQDIRDWTAFERPGYSNQGALQPRYDFGDRNRTGFTSTPLLETVNLALTERDRSYSTRRDRIDVTAEFDFSAPRELTGLNVDLGFRPSVAWYDDGDVSVRRLGAEFRLGQNFDQRGQQVRSQSWYIFAGAEGEALVWDAGTVGFNASQFLAFNGFALRDRVTVGDIQAGVSVERWGGQLSLAYMRREIAYGDPAFERELVENFGGISFTFSR